MEKKTMGAFMAALRKANGLTQQQVADKLNVSNKTISKWECNEGYPEISMLPVIAELYSVTVDELLRGERITKTYREENRDFKSEERKKYLIEKAKVRFTNYSIVSIILGALSLILAYTISDIVYDFNVIWVGYVIILILCAASCAVVLIAFNNFTSSLNNEDIVQNETVEENVKICIKYISGIVFLAVVTLIGLLLDIILDGPSYLFVALPVTAIVGIVVTFFVRSFLYKKFKVADTGLSYEQKIYLRKHIKITSIILAVVILVTFLLPFVFAWYETSEHTIYSFADGVGYQYESEQEAEREYHKLKDYVTGEKTLYYVTYEDYAEETDEYILYVEALGDSFEYSQSGYNMVETKVTEEEKLRFKNLEEVENFKKENVCDDSNTYNIQQRNLIFDDETLSVSYQSGTGNVFNGVKDIMPVFIIIGSCSFVLVLFVSGAILFTKIKKMK